MVTPESRPDPREAEMIDSLLFDAGWSDEDRARIRETLDPERCPARCGGIVGHPGHHQTDDYGEIVREARSSHSDVSADLRAALERSRQEHARHDIGHEIGAWPRACIACFMHREFAPILDQAVDAPQSEERLVIPCDEDGCINAFGHPGPHMDADR